MYYKNIEIICFDSFGVEYAPKEMEKLIEHKNIKTRIFRVQSNNSIMCGYFCIGFTDFIFAGKNQAKLILLVFFRVMMLKKMTIYFFVILKMNKENFIEAANTSGLSDQTKFRLNEINKIKDYFSSEIQERKMAIKKLRKHISAFDYIDKTFSCFICNK